MNLNDAPFGAQIENDGVRFTTYAADAETVWVCLFDDDDRQISATRLSALDNGIWSAKITGIGAGQRYGLRADGPFEPGDGLWFDPTKLLTDPHTTRIDRCYRWSEDLAGIDAHGVETAQIVPKSVVEAPHTHHAPPPVSFRPGGLIYETNVRAFTMLHPGVPPDERGTIRALAQPDIIAHLTNIGVSAIQLMPIAAWIDEAHLARRGLRNGWGYNPVCFMALDPRLAPGGYADLRYLCDTLRQAGIGVLLDVVFNHTGEGDIDGPTLSLRGLANRQVFRHDQDGRLVNHAGTGNTLACDHDYVMRLILDSLRQFAIIGGVDGFRFDLAPVLGRTKQEFSPDAPLIRAMLEDPVVSSRVLIAEPWDIGPGGYQLGQFPAPLLEWNDRFRDDVRKFWRGDQATKAALATRLAGSSDVFQHNSSTNTRSVNFIAAHDGYTLSDIVSYKHKHNEANMENNQDGHDENYCWNNGQEGKTDDPDIVARRRNDAKALLTTLFASRGTIMLTAGDEFARTQKGNNNAYCQDNELTWLDWKCRDADIENHVIMLARLRSGFDCLTDISFFSGAASKGAIHPDVDWLDRHGTSLTPGEWENSADDCFAKLCHTGEETTPLLAFLFNRQVQYTEFRLPCPADHQWTGDGAAKGVEFSVPPRSVGIAILQLNTPVAEAGEQQ